MIAFGTNEVPMMTNENDMQAIYIMKNGDSNVLQMHRRPKPIPKKRRGFGRAKVRWFKFY